MFEKSNEIAKFWSSGKLTAVKLTRKRNKKKTDYSPDYEIRFRVEVALNNKQTNKQEDCLYGSLKLDEVPAFIEALKLFGSKAYQYKVTGQSKMPQAEIFSTYGGYENNGQAISTKLWVSTAGPGMNADFFITADEAYAVKDEKGAFKRPQNTKSIKKISMSLSAEEALAIASQCQSALNILDMWSAMGTLDDNLDRIFPLRDSYGNAQQSNQYQSRQPAQTNDGYNDYPNRGYAARGGYANAPDQNYNQGYAAAGNGAYAQW